MNRSTASQTDANVLDGIVEILSATEWNVEMLELIAEIVTRTGRSIDEPEED